MNIRSVRHQTVYINMTTMRASSRIVRMMFVSDASKVRGFLEGLAKEPWKAITLSHGDAITDDCAGHLRRAAERL